MSDAFNDDLSADMSDPEFAAEFERTTDEVRRERYAAAIAEAAEPNDLDIGHWIHEWYPEAGAAIALADEEIRVSKMEAAQIITRRWAEESARANRIIQDLRSDLQESADALDESAQLLEDALSDNRRMTAELESLRAELEKTHAQGSGAIHPFADEGSASLFMEAAALRGQAASLKAENKRLRAELEEQHGYVRDLTDEIAECKVLEHQAAISRVRAVLDEWYGTSDARALSAEIRTALNGESS